MNTLRDARLREQRLAKDKYTSTDYKLYQKNFGFGRDFLPFETETKQEKSEKAKKREEYARKIKERNQAINDTYKYDKYANANLNYNEPAGYTRRAQPAPVIVQHPQQVPIQFNRINNDYETTRRNKVK